MKKQMKMDNSSKKSGRIILALFSTLFVVLAFWIMLDCFTTKRGSTKSVITYKELQNIDYRVNLKANEFYDSKNVNKNKKFVTNLIDTIDVNYSYEIVASNFFKSKTEYNVVATIQAYYKDKEDNTDSVIWSKDYKLIPTTIKTVEDGTDLKIKEVVRLDFNKYNQEALRFLSKVQKDAKIFLNVKMYVNTNGKVIGANEKINENSVLNLNIPLGKEVTTIIKDENSDVNKRIVTKYQVNEKFNLVLFTISLFIIITVSPLMIMSYLTIYNLSNMNSYDRKVKKIKREISDVLVEVDSKLKLDNDKVINVKTIDDLLNVQEELKLPVNYLEVKKEVESWFIIIASDSVYRYIVKADVKDLPKRKGKKNK